LSFHLMKHSLNQLAVFAACSLLIASVAQHVHADEANANAAAEIFFEKRVRPVLAQHCFECHSADEAENGLRLDSLTGMLAGGERGPAIVLGKPKESLLVRAIGHGEKLQMPPEKKLPAAAIADLATWIKGGAKWPNSKPVTAVKITDKNEPNFTDEQKSFWSFQSPAKPPLPPVQDRDWAVSPIDRFLLARLEAAGLKPALEADARTLTRRATFDLIGLPPTPEEIEAFEQDSIRNPRSAFRNLVDRLLASPHYGERWGRRWLDVARYGDSNGLDENLAFANAFRYRDYVISAFNNDKPYDRFVVEQLAGDLMGDDDPTSLSDRITATGFLSLGAKMLAEDDPVKMQMDIIDEQVDTMGRAFMGLTFGCARCHDHKFDPIPTADYYSLAGIFKSTKTMENFKVVAVWHERKVDDPAATAQHVMAQEEAAAAQARIDKAAAKANDRILREARANASDYFRAAAQQLRLDEAASKLLVDGKPPATDAPHTIVREAETCERGNISRLNDGYGKGIGVIAGPAGKNTAEFDLLVEKSGWYMLVSRYAAAEARPTNFLVNGSVAIANAVGEVTGSWYPDTQKWFVEGAVWLDAGNVVVGLERANPIPHIDKLVFIPAPDGFKLARKDNLHSAFVQQWAEFLRKSKEEADSPLAAWHAVAAARPLSELKQGVATEVMAETGLSATPRSIDEVTNAFADTFTRADQATNPSPGLRSLKSVLDDEGPLRVPDQVETLYAEATRNEITQLRKVKAEAEKQKPAQHVVMAVSDSKPQDLKIHIRGSHLTLGRQVPRQFPAILAPARQPLPSGASGRLELARWMTRADHPLTARVMVNRIWQGHFGDALVRSPDNFGLLGQRPTHPQLLDWLAVRFVESGWSIKAMHREIMLSSAYRMSTRWNEKAAEVDPENRLWWRANRRRLEAEAVRDSILAVSGRLDRAMGGSMLPKKNREYVTSTANVNPDVYQSNRRSVYLPVVRSAIYEVLQAFDFPDPTVSSARRQSSTVAPQALFMMNSKIVADASRAMAERLLADGKLDDAGRARQAYRIALGRTATDSEVQSALSHVARYAAALQPHESDASKRRTKSWQSLCRAIIASNEFIFVE
jgi:mono/diheme cytochrome c family protein